MGGRANCRGPPAPRTPRECDPDPLTATVARPTPRTGRTRRRRTTEFPSAPPERRPFAQALEVAGRHPAARLPSARHQPGPEGTEPNRAAATRPPGPKQSRLASAPSSALGPRVDPDLWWTAPAIPRRPVG